MRINWIRALAMTVLASLVPAVKGRGETSLPLMVTANGYIHNWVEPGDVQFINFQEVTQPLDLGLPSQPLDISGLGSGSTAPAFSLSPSVQEAATASVGSNAIGTGETRVNPTTDLGSALQSSDNVQTLNAQRRSPVSFDPHVRGYRFGEIYTQAAGEYFLPARLDLDSMLSKIDPYLIQTATVIPGPYGLRYGPGFAFIDVVTLDTPRSDCGPVWSNRFSVTARGNGSQILGQDTAQLAGDGYGLIAAYSLRNGSDYFAGNGQQIPSSFHNQNVLLQYGFDTADGNVEFRYNRYDMWNTEYALAFFDVNSMQTDSYNLSYTTYSPQTDARNDYQVWYNQNAFNGDNLNSSKAEIRQRVANGLNRDVVQDFGVLPNVPFSDGDFQGYVAGNLVSTGARAVRTYGDDTDWFLRTGVDVRYITQSTQENFRIQRRFVPPNPNSPSGEFFPQQGDVAFTTSQPHSAMTDPGLFFEYGTPWTSYFRTTVGGRVDWVNTHAGPPVSDYENDTLGSGYITSDLELSPEWTVKAGAGYAERVPDLVNRYSDAIFLAIMQNGLSRVVGDSDLRKEQATQLDTSILADYGVVSGRATAFYAWINDYNTYSALGVQTPPAPLGAEILVATNTSLATLGGFELYGDYHLSEVTSFFAAMQYVEGSDRQIDRPLPQIYPLQGRFGVRWTDPLPSNDHGLEWGFRLVAAQNRAGFIHDNFDAQGDLVPFEQRTPGFYTSYLRGYYNLTDNMHLTGGVENLFDRNYLEHLDIRLRGPAQTAGGVTAALAPGFTAYAGIEWLL